MALAGTQQKNREGQYQWRDKEMVEHELVGKHIQSVFSKLHHSEVTKNGPYTVTSGKVAHLRTDFTFKVNTAGQIEKLLTELHPTPAIGGLPVTEGLECISKYEGYDRTYYCGILGETNFDTFANLYVNLRCMKISQGEAAIFVGGGITSSSDPDEEWQETVIKSKTMMDILHPPK